ncbi:hypothetical protein CEUSTIGMA_g10297.t1 [Chlamydomonas eustigma]|uniref:Exostosin GT47 domain-containing protein n=1 Tax=Chlamydomonas eustigma TaxID=1157962 RepID=A0A250XIG3_9CHLO|nr:hypothetical protein CEUSTIGMA_g10297.t1 [Chlamydomonas eustigma]|eukprot:GAX82871.1 hypothetical protein CEUSTIGMA_g10297.t1 [Chlamydomonas eustigma]
MNLQLRVCIKYLLSSVCVLFSFAFNSVADSSSLKIYVYDLPRWKNSSTFGDSSNFEDISDSDYGLDQIFPEVLKNSTYVTTKPEEADYFFADAWIFWPHALNHMDDILLDIRAFGPWFDRKNGSDHIFVITADQGRCQYEEKEGRKPHHAVRNSIFIQHYGGSLHSNDFFNEDLTKRWGGELDRLMTMTEALRSRDGCTAPNIRCTEDVYGRLTPFLCHIPYQDIVVPPAVFERRPPHPCLHCHFGVHNEMAWKTPYTHPELISPSHTRDTLLFHAGHALFQKDNGFYSLGARQNMIEMFGRGQKPGYELAEEPLGSNYWTKLLKSKFCLGTTGTGWGSRFKVALVHGCIPVIMMDGVKNEFEEQLPLMEYTVRIPGYMAYRTPQILDELVTSGRAAQMQENLKCAWRLHWWRSPHGKAFEVVMCELKRRKLELPKGRIHIDFKTCSIKCIDEIIPIVDSGNNFLSA